MLTELWESDPFTERKESLLDTLDTDYHWSKGDVISITRGGGPRRYRVIHAQVEIGDTGLKREILVMRI